MEWITLQGPPGRRPFFVGVSENLMVGLVYPNFVDSVMTGLGVGEKDMTLVGNAKNALLLGTLIRLGVENVEMFTINADLKGIMRGVFEYDATETPSICAWNVCSSDGSVGIFPVAELMVRRGEERDLIRRLMGCIPVWPRNFVQHFHLSVRGVVVLKVRVVPSETPPFPFLVLGRVMELHPSVGPASRVTQTRGDTVLRSGGRVTFDGRSTFVEPIRVSRGSSVGRTEREAVILASDAVSEAFSHRFTGSVQLENLPSSITRGRPTRVDPQTTVEWYHRSAVELGPGMLTGVLHHLLLSHPRGRADPGGLPVVHLLRAERMVRGPLVLKEVFIWDEAPLQRSNQHHSPPEVLCRWLRISLGGPSGGDPLPVLPDWRGFAERVAESLGADFLRGRSPEDYSASPFAGKNPPSEMLRRGFLDQLAFALLDALPNTFELRRFAGISKSDPGLWEGVLRKHGFRIEEYEISDGDRLLGLSFASSLQGGEGVSGRIWLALSGDGSHVSSAVVLSEGGVSVRHGTYKGHLPRGRTVTFDGAFDWYTRAFFSVIKHPMEPTKRVARLVGLETVPTKKVLEAAPTEWKWTAVLDARRRILDLIGATGLRTEMGASKCLLATIPGEFNESIATLCPHHPQNPILMAFVASLLAPGEQATLNSVWIWSRVEEVVGNTNLDRDNPYLGMGLYLHDLPRYERRMLMSMVSRGIRPVVDLGSGGLLPLCPLQDATPGSSLVVFLHPWVGTDLTVLSSEGGEEGQLLVLERRPSSYPSIDSPGKSIDPGVLRPRQVIARSREGLAGVVRAPANAVKGVLGRDPSFALDLNLHEKEVSSVILYSAPPRLYQDALSVDKDGKFLLPVAVSWNQGKNMARMVYSHDHRLNRYWMLSKSGSFEGYRHYRDLEIPSRSKCLVHRLVVPRAKPGSEDDLAGDLAKISLADEESDASVVEKIEKHAGA